MTKHVKDQNWFAVGLDFFIVVFGVFMGFQVQQWNETRRDKSDAHQYLKQLVTDMELSAVRNKSQVKWSLEYVESYDLILDALDTCQLEQTQKPVFAAGLYNLGKIDMPIMVMGTINELNATGDFSLIGNIALRRQLAEAVREQQTTLAIDNQITARTVPSINYVRSRVRFNLDKHLSSPREVDPVYILYDFGELCADKKFINAIATVREMTLATISFTEARLKDQEALVGILQKNIGNDKPSKEAQ